MYVCTHAHMHVCMRTCTHLFSLNNANTCKTRTCTCTIYACPYVCVCVYIYIYIYIHICTHTRHIDECMHHDDACTDLCFSLTHMHAHRLPHPDMLHYTRGASRLSIVRCHITRRHIHCKRRLARDPQGVGQTQMRVHVHA